MSHPLCSGRFSISNMMLAGVLLGCAFAPRAPAQDSRSTLNFVSVTDIWEPGDLATDPYGNVYATEGVTGEIVKLSADGTTIPVPAFSVDPSGKHIPAKFWDLHGIAVAADGSVYLATFRTLHKISPDGATRMLADGFKYAQSISVSASGNIYIADSGAHVIRQVSPTGIMTTFAGKLDEPGSSDGGDSARFNSPTGIVVDANETLFVADNGNKTIRTITPDGVVSTLAGRAGVNQRVDGVGSAARFISPYRIAIDRFGTLYVGEGESVTGPGYHIRQISPDGAVTTIIGSGGFGAAIEAGGVDAIAIDRSGNFYITDWWYGALFVSPAPAIFAAHLAGQSVAPGGTATFSASITGPGPMTYQWKKNGIDVAGATTTSLIIPNVQAADLGNYTLVATNANGSSTTNPAALTFISAANRLNNLAIRSSAGTGARTLIMGFVVGGTGTTGATPLLIRGTGPALEAYGVPTFLADPMLTVFSGATPVMSNDNWGGDAHVSAIGAQVGAFSLTSSGSRDAALYTADIGVGAHTVQISGTGGATGVALAEIYDANSPTTASGTTPRLLNVSARTYVGTGADILIAGFNIGGSAAKTLLIRAIGPTLSALGVTDVLADPKLELFQRGSVVQSNDNWGGNAVISSVAAEVGAFALADTSRDAALLVTLQPGSYTVHVSGVANTTGVALVEIYEVP